MTRQRPKDDSPEQSAKTMDPFLAAQFLMLQDASSRQSERATIGYQSHS